MALVIPNLMETKRGPLGDAHAVRSPVTIAEDLGIEAYFTGLVGATALTG